MFEARRKGWEVGNNPLATLVATFHGDLNQNEAGDARKRRPAVTHPAQLARPSRTRGGGNLHSPDKGDKNSAR